MRWGCSDGTIGAAFDALREAFHGEQSGNLMLLTYHTLTTEPTRAVQAVYDFIGEPAFTHDFENVEYDAEDFDRRLGTPGLHRVERVVQATERETILPPDLFARLTADSFGPTRQEIRSASASSNPANGFCQSNGNLSPVGRAWRP